MKNCKDLGVDVNKIVIAGDSAGGNAAAVINQKLLEEKQKLPKIQVLIYPKLQMANFKMASMKKYNNTSVVSYSGVKGPKYISWYLGVNELNPGYTEFLNALVNNDHWALIEDKELLNRYKSYFDISKIPDEYKTGHSYYTNFDKNTVYPNSKLDRTNILVKDSNINRLVKKLFNRDVSPLLSETKYLIGLPKAYFIIFEWDDLKDEGLLYAERLKKEANVDVKIAFYEKAFHGIQGLVNKLMGYQIARNIRSDLIEYLKKNL